MQTTKIQKRLLGAALAASLAVGLTTTGFGQTVIGNFETPSLDGWGTDGGPGSPTLAQSQFPGSVTLGSYSLASSTAAGGFWGPSTGNLAGEGYLNAFDNSPMLSYSLDFDAASLAGDPGGSTYYNGYAQDNEMSISVYSAAFSLNMFLQENWGAAGVSDSTGQGAEWNGIDGARTIVWNLNAFTTTDPNAEFPGTLTVGQLLNDYATAYGSTFTSTLDLKVNFVQQIGSGYNSVGPGIFYFDDVQLVPEPSTIAMLLVGGVMLIGVTVRRSRLSRS